MNSLIERVNAASADLTDSQRQIATFLLRSKHNAAFLTAADIAAQVGVSESTVVRFARALGYRGFPELQRFLREAVIESLTPTQRLELTESHADGARPEDGLLDLELTNLRQTLTQVDVQGLEEVAKALHAARTKLVVGMRSSRGAALLLGHYVGRILPNVQVVTNADEMLECWQWMEAQDALVAFSFPRYATATIQGLQRARDVGTFSAVITDSPMAPPVSLATRHFIAPATSGFFGNSFTAAVSVCNLLVAYCVRIDPAGAHQQLKRAEAATATRDTLYRAGGLME